MMQLKNVNPIEATNAFVKRESYGFVNTRDVLSVFEANGWKPVNTQVAKVKKAERQGFQKHLIKLEHADFQTIPGLTDANRSKPQLVVLNSHDGTSSLQVLWGLLRIACLNGIIAGTGLNGVRLVHSKSITDRLPDAIQYMLDNLPKFHSQIAALQGLQLSQDAQAELIKTLYDARLSGIGRLEYVQYNLANLQRAEDKATDAYTVFNRVQETLMRGGIRYGYTKEIRDESGNVVAERLVETTTRRIASVSSQVKLNQLAYDTALKLAA